MPGVLSLQIFAALAFAASDTFAADWEVVGRQGRMQFVLVPTSQAIDRQFFERAAKALCPSAQVCQVMFWTERQYVPSRTPFTDTQLSKLAAQYNQNPNTGLTQLLLPCRVDP